ncbi:MAG: hypothetical protein NW206_20035 [Hyphomonadaceae bacterium]|nr:hypothetical protein [Hyphomonadaceae bacterium]
MQTATKIQPSTFRNDFEAWDIGQLEARLTRIAANPRAFRAPAYQAALIRRAIKKVRSA